MKKFLIILIAVILLFSGCVGQKTVKTGDKISVDYTGSLPGGKVFDTSVYSVARENGLYAPEREYKPLKLTVGKGDVIPGFDEGVVGMKVGETKTLTIPPEKAYGQSNPMMIQVIPAVEDVPATRVIPKIFEVPRDQFERTLGKDHEKGEVVKIPETNINLTILNITSIVSLSYNLKEGDNLWSSGAPWNETVVKIDEKNITLKANLSMNEIIQLQGAPWNTTVVEVKNMNITLRHNPIPDTVIPTMRGMIRVHFNETSIIMDQNPELAGKTLIFSVTLKSIDK
ncbi:MAG: FKBP-type peptidyl-prolyl cis-trans isomerase [Candidatus Methanoperedens sp.]|nr:FKBP-type peptidyl-prolyl cis-trans isomerase [Candidatus Methanoperedens sp.]